MYTAYVVVRHHGNVLNFKFPKNRKCKCSMLQLCLHPKLEQPRTFSRFTLFLLSSDSNTSRSAKTGHLNQLQLMKIVQSGQTGQPTIGGDLFLCWLITEVESTLVRHVTSGTSHVGGRKSPSSQTDSDDATTNRKNFSPRKPKVTES